MNQILNSNIVHVCHMCDKKMSIDKYILWFTFFSTCCLWVAGFCFHDKIKQSLTSHLLLLIIIIIIIITPLNNTCRFLILYCVSVFFFFFLLVLLTAVIFTVALGLGAQGQQEPCQQTSSNNAYDTFVHRHILNDNNLDRNSKASWEKWVKSLINYFL